jgi:ATP/maltotriose-dependent transcriptional regulator MalT
MTTGGNAIADLVAAGAAALAEGRWADARARFEAQLAVEESPAAWEGLGWAGYWLHDAELTIRSRERAYQAYRAQGDDRDAGRMAAWLAADFLEFRGDDAIASGWLERSHRLLDDLAPCADQGWLALIEGSFRLGVEADLDAAAQAARRAAELGRREGVSDLEAIGLSLEGLALVGDAQVAEGMRRLDEASAIATGERLELPISLSWALCYVVAACEGVGDFPRATQWCEAMRVSAERWGARHSRGVCRSTYGTVLATCGDWTAAEAELTGALADLEAARPGMVGAGLARLGELRARQGRVDEARALFERAGSHHAAVLGLGNLALDEDDPDAAADAAERVLRRLSRAGVLQRLPALELLVRARCELGDVDAAAAAADELARLVRAVGTPYLDGRAALVAAEVAMARGDYESARRACEDALDRFGDTGARYDAAIARRALARALAALGRRTPAEAEARAAREELTALGAARDAARAEAGNPPAELTPRELEVLRLVARGLSNAEIAEQLVLSPHTVHRHVANVRAKLRLPSRAAAVAYAARAGLI